MSKIKRIIAVISVSVMLAGAYTIGQYEGSTEVYAAAMYDNLNAFKVEGDYLEIATDTVGKASLAAQLPERSHVAAVGGIYNIQIWTPRGENSSTYNKKGELSNTYYGTPGQYLNVDVKIAKGSKITTVGNLAEGVGIRGIIQLAGGNGASPKSPQMNGSCDHAGYAYFGGVGGNGITGDFYSGGYVGGTGYIGGKGGRGGTSSNTFNSAGTGGDGYIAGEGGDAGSYTTKVNNRDVTYTGNPGVSGNVYPMNYPSPINQVREGTVKSKTGGAFPSFTTIDYNGTDARIRITLKTITPVGPNDGIVSIEVNQSSSWEAMMQIGSAMDRIATAMESGKVGSGGNGGESSSTTPNIGIITVIAGKQFSEFTNVSDDNVIGGTTDGITAINNNSKDGVVKLMGNMPNTGQYQVSIGGMIYTIKVISEPDSTNIKAVLN